MEKVQGAKETLLYRDEVFAIQGAAFEVYKEMGNGFLEAVYQECLSREFYARGIPFASQQPLRLAYKGAKLKQTYVPDFICYGKIIVELKGVKEVVPEHRAQVLNYLAASKLRLGLIINFGHYPKVQIERIIL
ncbi:MAG: GxxExxY protein [Elusimicrobiales bacterium]|nr:GxxExxY protein [Elusimicrobiales bacterium]